MHCLITGATGLVGRRVSARLAADGHRVTAASRRERPESSWPSGVKGRVWDAVTPPNLDGIDAVIHLAGASIGGQRWSKPYQQVMIDSRVNSTRAIAAAINDQPADSRPVLVCASAVGYYGRDPSGPCPEDRAPGEDYLARLCVAWEGAAQEAQTRVVRFRFGHVMGLPDGILGRLLPIYKARLGGPIAGGKQGLPWIHVDDVAGALAWAAATPNAEEAYNLAAPNHVSQGGFNDALADVLGVWAKAPMPGFALRLVVGKLGPYLVGGQEAPPNRLMAAGFRFEHPELAGALEDILAAPRGGSA